MFFASRLGEVKSKGPLEVQAFPHILPKLQETKHHDESMSLQKSLFMRHAPLPTKRREISMGLLTTVLATLALNSARLAAPMSAVVFFAASMKLIEKRPKKTRGLPC